MNVTQILVLKFDTQIWFMVIEMVAGLLLPDSKFHELKFVTLN